ncbi:hypothetical protein CON09_15930 [Bacillus anthracis]|nr:hypothetical protein CON09_15930 [Bacillus anthracis]
MKLPFEEWLEKQSIPLGAEELFKESIVCYKAAAYRASLLFSFLGLQTIIKYRVLESKKPDNYNEHAWKAVCDNLRKDEKWDEEVNTSVNKKDRGKVIFNISEDLRSQYTYWKNRRNDCAHSKENIINNSHVESFWLFLQSNLAKLAVKGSKEALLEKISKHFDIRFTSINTGYSHILADISHAINEEELEEFYNEVHTIFITITNTQNVFVSDKDIHPFIKFWDDLFNIGGAVTEKLVSFFKRPDNNGIFRQYLEQIPKGVIYFRDDAHFIRNLWYEKLPKHYLKYKILSSMLRNNLIPNEEKDEAFSRLINEAAGAKVDEEDFYVLKDSGFFEKLREIAFEEGLINDFTWSKINTELVLLYLNKVGLDERIADRIISTFSRTNYPWALCSALRTNFEENEELKEQFKELARNLSRPIPENLGIVVEVQETT